MLNIILLEETNTTSILLKGHTRKDICSIISAITTLFINICENQQDLSTSKIISFTKTNKKDDLISITVNKDYLPINCYWQILVELEKEFPQFIQICSCQ